MPVEKQTLTERINAVMADIESLPEAENDEQRQALAGLNEAARIFKEIAVSAEAFLEEHKRDNQ